MCLQSYLYLTHKSICLFLLNCEIKGQQRIELRVIIIDISHHYIHRSGRGLKTRNLQVTSIITRTPINNIFPELQSVIQRRPQIWPLCDFVW